MKNNIQNRLETPFQGKYRGKTLNKYYNKKTVRHFAPFAQSVRKESGKFQQKFQKTEN